MSIFKGLFRKKTPEELRAELEALVKAQERDNEMIKEWFTFRSPKTEEEMLTVRQFWEEYENDRIFNPINSYDAANMWNGLEDD